MNFKDPKECLHFLERQCEKFRENIHAREILNLNYDDNQTIDLSGLTDEEMNLVYRLITIFRRSHRERSTNNEN